MKRLALVLLLLSSFGCGRKVVSVQGFEKYVAAFESAAASSGKPLKVDDLIIQFGGTGFRDIELANCDTFPTDSPIIRVNEAKWNGESELMRELILFHEMGHCVLGKDHETTRSIMQADLDQIADYGTHKNEYWRELFQ